VVGTGTVEFDIGIAELFGSACRELMLLSVGNTTDFC
jgi:hypothetical protein